MENIRDPNFPKPLLESYEKLLVRSILNNKLSFEKNDLFLEARKDQFIMTVAFLFHPF